MTKQTTLSSFYAIKHNLLKKAENEKEFGLIKSILGLKPLTFCDRGGQFSFDLIMSLIEILTTDCLCITNRVHTAPMSLHVIFKSTPFVMESSSMLFLSFYIAKRLSKIRQSLKNCPKNLGIHLCIIAKYFLFRAFFIYSSQPSRSLLHS